MLPDLPPLALSADGAVWQTPIRPTEVACVTTMLVWSALIKRSDCTSLGGGGGGETDSLSLTGLGLYAADDPGGARF